MKQAAKASALVLAVSLLSGCSNAEAKACKAAEQAKIEYELQSDVNFNAYQKEIDDNKKYYSAIFIKGVELLSNSKRVIVNNPKCFTPQQVAEAQTYLLTVK
jgi:outer membrane murein-binding lipoprotein Lpp